MLLTVIFTATLAAASPLGQDVPTAQDSTQNGGIVVTGEMNKKNKRVCKRAVATGSIMAKSTCKTVGEWEAEKLRNEIAADKMRLQQRFAEQEQLDKMLAGH